MFQLPVDLQERVKSHMSQNEIITMENACNASMPAETTKMIRVPMPTFPPTAMVYSVNNKMTNGVNSIGETPPTPPPQTVPTDLIARVLTPPTSKRRSSRIFICSRCHKDYMFEDKQVQTVISGRGSSETFRTVTPSMNNPTGFSSATLVHPSVHSQRSRTNSSTETEI